MKISFTMPIKLFESWILTERERERAYCFAELPDHSKQKKWMLKLSSSLCFSNFPFSLCLILNWKSFERMIHGFLSTVLNWKCISVAVASKWSFKRTCEKCMMVFADVLVTLIVVIMEVTYCIQLLPWPAGGDKEHPFWMTYNLNH